MSEPLRDEVAPLAYSSLEDWGARVVRVVAVAAGLYAAASLIGAAAQLGMFAVTPQQVGGHFANVAGLVLEVVMAGASLLVLAGWFMRRRSYTLMLVGVVVLGGADVVQWGWQMWGELFGQWASLRGSMGNAWFGLFMTSVIGARVKSLILPGVLIWTMSRPVVKGCWGE